MVKRATIEFIEVDEPVTNLVTKFGGRPVWVEQPQWPISRSTGKPMRFICQIALTAEIFGAFPGKMAYIFMTDDADDFVDGTWEPDSGENAVIIQPGDVPGLEVQPISTGPTLVKLVQRLGNKLLEAEPCEFAVRLEVDEDPEFVPDVERVGWDNEASDQYLLDLEGNKIGGTPGFLQGDEFPEGGPWRLLLQIDSTDVPFDINFGDAGIGYAFISEDGRSGKFLWQCA